MVDKTAAKECCEGKEAQEGKKIKAADLPIHGNPYPPKDVVDTSKPGLLESKITSFRHKAQPYVSPFLTAFGKTQDFVSIGIAHSQSSMQRLAESQSVLTNSLVISSASLIGLALARRKGFFKKIFYTSLFGGAATVACFPTDAEEKAHLLWYVAKEKLPGIAKSQYEKIAVSKKETEQSTSQPVQK